MFRAVIEVATIDAAAPLSSEHYLPVSPRRDDDDTSARARCLRTVPIRWFQAKDSVTWDAGKRLPGRRQRQDQRRLFLSCAPTLAATQHLTRSFRCQSLRAWLKRAMPVKLLGGRYRAQILNSFSDFTPDILAGILSSLFPRRSWIINRWVHRRLNPSLTRPTDVCSASRTPTRGCAPALVRSRSADAGEPQAAYWHSFQAPRTASAGLDRHGCLLSRALGWCASVRIKGGGYDAARRSARR